MNKNYLIGPHQMAFDITNRCNLRCLHCFNSSGENAIINNELSDSEVINFIASLLPIHLFNLCFCGGETLIRKDLIVQCAKMLSNTGTNVSLVTNGCLITKDVVRELVAAGITNIQFSLDGMTPKSHDKLRNQQGVYEKVIQAIGIANEYKLRIAVAFTPTSFNYHELKDIHKFLQDIAFYRDGRIQMELRCQPLMKLGRANKNLDSILLNDQQYRELVSEIDSINAASPALKIDWGDPIDHLLRFTEKTDMIQNFSNIRANGDITVSPYLPLIVGNIRKHSFIDYWNHGLNDIWRRKIPRILASFLKSIYDMGTLSDILPETFNGEEIYLDLFEYDLDDENLIKKYLLKKPANKSQLGV